MPDRTARNHRGFTLVELLVVIGIIALLIGMLMPALAASRAQAQSVACKSSLKQNYLFMQIYANENKGYMFPQGMGAGQPRTQRWPLVVFRPPVWNPPTMTCPSDLEPREEHSYVVNNHFKRHQIRLGATKGVSHSDVILMGEKKSSEPDYYMDLQDFNRVVEQWRHGLRLGSNYLYMDGHVDTDRPDKARGAIDPWDPTVVDSAPKEGGAAPN
jgi:prepilin-type N-terminal cleavage/methylation domain-containing protein/prepilin-type processing-associated H-X9-DG protein